MKKGPKRKKPARAPKRDVMVGKRAPRDGWLSKFRLAAQLGVHRNTVIKYLQMPGAPAPDDQMRYDAKAVAAWIAEKGSGAVEGSLIQQLKEEKLQIELREMRRQEAKANGTLVDVKEIEPTIKAMFAEHTAQLRQEFEQILPGKYKGKTLGECQQLNAEALDRVLLALARGCWSVGAAVAAPQAATPPAPPPAPPDQPAAAPAPTEGAA